MKTFNLLSLFLVLLILSCKTNFTTNYSPSLSKEEVKELKPINSIESFTLTTLDNKNFVVGKGSEKTTLLIFFATWCPSCKVAIPELESSFATNNEINFIVVGREHSKEEMKKWRKIKNFKFHLVADEDRLVYDKFATQYIPRIYLIDKNGTVLYQSYGWSSEMIDEIKQKLE
ncbi:AhpC/TSA family protein [Bernardetia litoralis DSM 6794]|uniref:AhpC/TSA family protein n=1 Tax=Bernardetia litoralis (strain ATCC 23117 / DSM 6794 / NBRC 15988 / NCIMB 1366 / Fx l1 / Sio-4) TaxID=880071 RepID=I4AIZ9_BERLS|nr:TlpA disulfide reductase family protein [Bernardetia litoralis]AFM03934.1 AhpC/TSA family protein [Bernardetia litoralis DSM 6794]